MAEEQMSASFSGKRQADQEQEPLDTSSSNNGLNDKRLRTDIPTTCISDEHAANCFTALNGMRKNGSFCDVVLVVEKMEILAHKNILAAASPYFHAMFSNLEEREDRFTIGGVEYEVFLSLIDHVYTACIELTEDNIESRLAAASLLQFTDAIKLCCDFLESQLKQDNCWAIRDIFDKHGCVASIKQVDTYIRKHFSEIIQYQEYLRLGHHRLIDLLKCDDLFVKSEEQVYESVLAWIQFDLNNRQQYLAEVMANVRFPMMSKDYLAMNVHAEPLFRDNPHCKEYILEAYQYQLFKDHPSLAVDTPRTRTRFNWRKVLMIVGGSDASIELCDLWDNRQYRGANMPMIRFRGRLACVNGKIYAVGGSGDMVSLPSLQTVDVYDRATDAWSQAASMSERRTGMGVAVLNGRIYAIGGCNGSVGLRTAEVYDPATDRWTYIAPMLSSRYLCGVGVINGEIYAIGGVCDNIESSSVERYNPAENKWTYVGSMNSVRVGAGVGILDNILYAIGGKIHSNNLSTCEKYDPVTNTWFPITSMNQTRESPGVAAYNGKLYAVGGYNGGRFDSIETYCPRRNSWSLSSWKMMSPRDGADVCIIDS